MQNTLAANNKLNAWFLAIRPKTLWAGTCPVLLAAALAITHGSKSYGLALVILVTAVTIQVIANLVNDYIDGIKGTDTNRLGPTRVVASGLISAAEIKKGIYVCVAVCLLLGLVLVFRGGWPILLIGVLGIICAVWYSYGPLALSYSGLADLFVFVFFGPVATAGTYYLMTLQWSYLATMLGIAPGLISIAILTANNARDYHSDLASGKKTLAVRFGLNFARFEYLLCLFAAIYLPASLTKDPVITITSVVFAILAYRSACQFTRAQNAEQFLPLLPATAQLLVLYTISYITALVIIS